MRRSRALVLLLLLVPLVVPAGLAAPQHDHIVYVLPMDGDRTATVYQWFPVSTEVNRTVALPVPLGADEHVVLTDDGRFAGFSKDRDGVLRVSIHAGVGALQVVTSGVVFAATDPVRFLDSPDLTTWVYLAVPPRYLPVPEADWQRVEPDGFGAVPELPGAWPVPKGPLLRATFEDLPRSVGIERVAGGSPVAMVGLAVALAAILLFSTLWLIVRVHASLSDPTRRRELPWMQHLEELRGRIIKIALTVLVSSAFFFVVGFRWVSPAAGALSHLYIPVPYPTIYDNVAAQVFTLLSRAVVPAGVEVVVITPWDAVITQITIAAALGVLVTFPVLFYQVYAFLAPGLYPPERRAVLSTVPVSVLLFLGGATFGIMGMMPFLVDVLYGFAGTLSATALLNVHDLVGLTVLMGITFGLAFQLPVVMALTARVGLVRAATYRRYWRHATVAVFVVAMLITDPTIISQIIVGSLLMVLYGIGLVLAYLFERRAPSPAASEPSTA